MIESNISEHALMTTDPLGITDVNQMEALTGYERRGANCPLPLLQSQIGLEKRHPASARGAGE